MPVAENIVRSLIKILLPRNLNSAGNMYELNRCAEVVLPYLKSNTNF
jgi:hypothetical protein